MSGPASSISHVAPVGPQPTSSARPPARIHRRPSSSTTDNACRAGLALLSDWLTGEVYTDAVVFSTHPNGHLFGDKQTDLLQMPICACMKALMKIKRPLDPRNPSEQLPLHKLSTLKLDLPLAVCCLFA